MGLPPSATHSTMSTGFFIDATAAQNLANNVGVEESNEQVVPQVNEQVQDDAAETESKDWKFSLSAQNKATFDGIWAKLSAIHPVKDQAAQVVSLDMVNELYKIAKHQASCKNCAGEENTIEITLPLPFEFADDSGHRGDLMPKDGDHGFDALIAECLEDSQTQAEGEQNVAKIINQYSVIMNYLPLTWEEYRIARQVFVHFDKNADGQLQAKELDPLQDSEQSYSGKLKLFPEELVIKEGETNLKKQEFMDYLYVSKILQAKVWSDVKPLQAIAAKQIEAKQTLKEPTADEESNWRAKACLYSQRFDCATKTMQQIVSRAEKPSDKKLNEIQKLEKEMNEAVEIKDYVTAGKLQTKVEEAKGTWFAGTKTSSKDVNRTAGKTVSNAKPAKVEQERASCECNGCSIS